MPQQQYRHTKLIFQQLLSQFRLARAPILQKLALPSTCVLIISTLNRIDQESSRIELANIIGLSTNALGRPIDRLIKLKLIKRTEDPINRKYIKLSLTKKSKVWNKAFTGLTDKEISSFTDTMEHMTNRLTI